MRVHVRRWNKVVPISHLYLSCLFVACLECEDVNLIVQIANAKCESMKSQVNLDVEKWCKKGSISAGFILYLNSMRSEQLHSE